jgi:hypothetical protein
MHSRHNETNNYKNDQTGLPKKIRGLTIMVVRGNLKLETPASVSITWDMGQSSVQERNFVMSIITTDIICTSITK